MMAEETLEQFKERIRREYQPMYYDRQGKEMDLMDWARKCEDMDYKIVKQDIFDRWFISTVWIGLNMRVFRQAAIQIFETMIFMSDQEKEDNKDPLYLYQNRYSTEEESLNGHEEALATCRRLLVVEKKIRELESLEVEIPKDLQQEYRDLSM